MTEITHTHTHTHARTHVTATLAHTHKMQCTCNVLNVWLAHSDTHKPRSLKPSLPLGYEREPRLERRILYTQSDTLTQRHLHESDV